MSRLSGSMPYPALCARFTVPYLCPIERNAVDNGGQREAQNLVFLGIPNVHKHQWTPSLAFVKHRSSVRIRAVALNSLNQQCSTGCHLPRLSTGRWGFSLERTTL